MATTTRASGKARAPLQPQAPPILGRRAPGHPLVMVLIKLVMFLHGIRVHLGAKAIVEGIQILNMNGLKDLTL